MLKKFLLNTSLLSLFILPQAFAEKAAVYKDFKFEGDTIHTLVPEGWEATNGFLNIPVALLSKKGAQDQRSVIQIIPLGNKEEAKDFARMEKDPQDYYDQKEESLAKTGGEVTLREPLKETKKDGIMTSSIGVQYKSNLGEFLDETHYVQAKSGSFYMVKDLIPQDQLSAHRILVSEVINTLSTKN